MATTKRTSRGTPGQNRVVHLRPEERAAVGKAARKALGRSTHAAWDPPADRFDPIGVLEEQAKSRVPDLVPIRYARMATSAFAFYRGAAAIMARDLASMPNTGLVAQLCGDAHISNFGVFGSPERELLFDINDFDETIPGPWEWDVKRLAASIAIAGRTNGFSDRERRLVLLEAVGGYRTAIAEFADMGNLDVWYAHLRVQQGLPQLREALAKKHVREAERIVEKARTRDSMQAFSKLTHLVDGKRQIISTPPLIVRAEELFPDETADRLHQDVHELIRAYRKTLVGDRRHLLEDFRFTDIARKVVGVGSVGTRAWIILMMGRDDEDPLFLQAKEAQHSVLEPFVNATRFSNQGRRVVEGQQLMQAASDIFLGWQRSTVSIDGVTRDFYVRQLRDWKGAWAPEAMIPAVMAFYGRACGWTLARAHARSGDRIAIASYLGNSDAFDRAIVAFAEAYADQNERDFEALEAAISSGRVTANEP
jgi:uncharacterized protein (DUF2252 family)